MFLKSLTLKGFKSFAEATTLDLEPGVTVVVGPNGSGKSNLVDAVAWVLGAQGPRTVRSSRMDDVIFAGAPGRPALGRAEVSLTIDNADGLLPIEFTEVTVTRTLFRSGDSEYAINGVPCRLLDVQELLSDAGVGRQQHVIVSQGHLAAVLDARPEDRRLVIEEAAGVRKFRRRRERTQRRLEATEANLVRLTDISRELRRQLRPLERQADAARRHGSLVAELRALRFHLAGRELAVLAGGLAASVAEVTELRAALDRVRAELAGLDADVAGAEQAVSPGDAEHLSETLSRAEGLRERARGLLAVVAERARSVARESEAAADEGVVASLESEAARLATELAAAESEAAALVPQADELAAAEAALAAERGRAEAAWVAPPDSPAAAAAEVRGELSALARAVDARRAEHAGLVARAAALGTEAARLAAAAVQRQRELEDAESAVRVVTPDLEAAQARRVAAAGAVAEADAGLADADRERRTWLARAEALVLALDEAQGTDPEPGAADRLDGVAGVAGSLRRLVEVEPGWELAFEAAAGESLAAVVVDSVATARVALARLREGESGPRGAVLAADVAGSPASLALDAAAATGAEPVRAHVRSDRPEVDRLLDGLLAHAVAVDGGWEDALDLALGAPGLVVVTRAGDRFATGGWRAGAPAAVAARAALVEARRQAAVATTAAEAAAADRAGAAGELAAAQHHEADEARRSGVAAGRRRQAAEAVQALEASRSTLAGEQATVADRAADVADRLARDEARVEALATRLLALEAAAARETERLVRVDAERARLDQRATALRALRQELSVQAAGLEERRAVLGRRRDDVERRLRGHAEARARAADRRLELDGRATALGGLDRILGARLADLDRRVAELRAERSRRRATLRAALDRLEGLRRRRVAAESELAAGIERAHRAEVAGAEVRLRHEAAVDAVRRELDCEPDAAVAAARPELPVGSSAPARARELDRELRLMGPVNPLAQEEFAALQERSRFVEGQLEDVRAGRRELAKVIKAVDEELVSVFSAAFADVAENYARIFETLFPGGTGRLRLTDPDNLLETGIELDARPSGKNIRSLSLLSGGERSLAALAFLFAVFRSRPSPFYLLDEVEAALDDINLHRFLSLIEEFRPHAQMVLVTHQKRTMEIADCLYGVTLQSGGSSRVLCERVAART